MFNGLIDSTQVQPRRGSSSRSSGDSTLRRHTEEDIAVEQLQQWMRQNEEYNLQNEALQVSMIVNN
jgi:hypothetical protein